MSLVDLHCHSTASDGTLAPAEVVRRAAANGARVLALTDHDHVAGLDEARAAAREEGVQLVGGVEISVTWRGQTVHVLGLGIDPAHEGLCRGLESVRGGRARRAELMAGELEKRGIRGSLEGAYAHAENPELIGRTHFARFLVEDGHAKDIKAVFRKYLAKGRPGYVKHEWATLVEAVEWIRASGGKAALAHPGRYPFGRVVREELMLEFRGLGGSAIEVVSASHTADQAQEFARAAARFGLAASAGSDFHGPGESWMDVGRVPALPEGCVPVWRELGFDA